jgi:methylisocitrate lyase
MFDAEEMVDRLMAAVAPRFHPAFVIMARTDAVAVEGLAAAIERACRYREAGADMLFPEALGELDQYRQFAEATGLPVLANLTEFGRTPLFTREELAGAGVALALYPLSAFRAMSAAALRVYRAIRAEGTQRGVVDIMQSRDELYRFLGYHACEERLDRLIAKEKKP